MNSAGVPRRLRFALGPWLLQPGLLFASLVTACLLGEGLSRLVLDRVDYLAVDPVFDSVLGHRLPPRAAGHDAWGFRNHDVPESAEVVTIGDSQTYGVSAPASLSWPAQLSRLTGHRVYNLGMGGYGPVQYEQLLRSRALQLHPAVVVIGFYFGNDVWDAYRTVYGLHYWAGLRREGIPTITDSVQSSPGRDVFLGSVRDWLARHSVLYRVISFTAVGGIARGLDFSARDHRSGIVPFQHPMTGDRTGFTPLLRLKALNLADPAVQEGLRLSLERLERISEECRVAKVPLLVALIPTKERVYAPWIARASDLRERDAFLALLRNESEVSRQVRNRLQHLGVSYLDLEMPLRKAVAGQAIFPASEDGHFNGGGYAVIAQAVANAIRPWLP